MFSNEYIVDSENIDGIEFSLFLDKCLVDEKQNAFKVTILSQEKDSSVIILPVESNNLGTIIKVKSTNLIDY
jgi:hypothetical protein